MNQHYYSEILEPLLTGETIHLITYLKTKGLLKSRLQCINCHEELRFGLFKRNVDKYANICINKARTSYTIYLSNRENSFFSII